MISRLIAWARLVRVLDAVFEEAVELDLDLVQQVLAAGGRQRAEGFPYLGPVGFRQSRRSAERVTAQVAAGHEGAEPLEKPGRDVCSLFRVSVRPQQAEKGTVPPARQVPAGAGLVRDAFLSPVVLQGVQTEGVLADAQQQELGHEPDMADGGQQVVLVVDGQPLNVGVHLLRRGRPVAAGVQDNLAGALVDGPGLELVDLVDENRVAGPQRELGRGHAAHGPTVKVDPDPQVALHEHVVVHDDDAGAGRLVDGRVLPACGNPGAGHRSHALLKQREARLAARRVVAGGFQERSLGASVRQRIQVVFGALSPLARRVRGLADQRGVLARPFVHAVGRHQVRARGLVLDGTGAVQVGQVPAHVPGHGQACLDVRQDDRDSQAAGGEPRGHDTDQDALARAGRRVEDLHAAGGQRQRLGGRHGVRGLQYAEELPQGAVQVALVLRVAPVDRFRDVEQLGRGDAQARQVRHGRDVGQAVVTGRFRELGVGGDGQPTVDLSHVLDEDLPGEPRARPGELRGLGAGARAPEAGGHAVDVAQRVAAEPRERGIGREGVAARDLEGSHDRRVNWFARVEARQQGTRRYRELPDVGKLTGGN